MMTRWTVNFARYMLSLFFRVTLLFGGGVMSAYGANGVRLLSDTVLGVDGAVPMGWAVVGTGVLGLIVACAGLMLGFLAAVGLLKRVQAGPHWANGEPTENSDRLLFEGELRARIAGIAVAGRDAFGKRS
jgi:hypothetical protein